MATHALIPSLGTADPHCPFGEPSVITRTYADFTRRRDHCRSCAEHLLAIASCMATVAGRMRNGLR